MTPCIAYTLRFPSAHQHYVDVTASFPAWPCKPKQSLALRLAVWTPGSYMVREYARHIEALGATDGDGEALPLHKVSKNIWQVQRDPGRVVCLRYRVYAREMTVRTNFVDSEFALLNGAPTFISAVGMEHLPHTIEVEPAASWGQVIVALPQTGPNGAYLAADYDTLVDTPWLLGNPDLRTFEVAGHTHTLATVGGEGTFDAVRAQMDTARIVREHHALWGTVPYANYVFINLLTQGRGGLEHKASSVLMASPHVTSNRADYVDWLGLLSHEFFHVWNIKRLRPIALGPFNYDAEVLTPSLWIAEGLTAYYDDLQVHRAQLCSQAEYLARLSRAIEQVQTAPGRLVQGLAAASFDAWIKFYRRDENTDNSAVSYYLKGSLVGFLLDALVRQSTDGQASLDTVMRLAYSRYAGAVGYTEAQFRALAAEVAGIDLTTFFATAVDSTEELDYAPALAWYGLMFGPSPSQSQPTSPQQTLLPSAPRDQTSQLQAPSDQAPSDQAPSDQAPSDQTPSDQASQLQSPPDQTPALQASPAPEGWLGITTQTDPAGRARVSQVLRQTPAYDGGVNVDDEIIAWDHYCVHPSQFALRIRNTQVGRTVPLVVARRERLITLPIVVAAKPQLKWHLCIDPKASAPQQTHLQAWLRSQDTDHR